MMKLTKTLLLLLFVCTIEFGFSISPVPAPTLPHAAEGMNIETFVHTPTAELQQLLGHELNWKDKLALALVKRKLKRQLKQNPEIGSLMVSALPAEGCSRIILKSGDVIEADVSQITPTEVKYKRCGKPGDPEIILAKEDVLSIQASDGEIIFRNTDSQPAYASKPTRNMNQRGAKIEGMGIASLVVGISGLIVGLFLTGIAGLVAGVIAVVLGAVSLNRIRRYPDQYAGKGLAWTGIICGTAITALFALAVLLYYA